MGMTHDELSSDEMRDPVPFLTIKWDSGGQRQSSGIIPVHPRE